MNIYHTPVLLKESLEGLNIKPDGVYVDATFGGGGHSKEILIKLKKGKLIAFDQDTDAKANAINEKRFIFVNANFRFFRNFLRYYEIGEIDGLIADMGVSSHHFDTGERGFSYRYDGELDMRMNKGQKFTAGVLLNTYTDKQLHDVFVNLGEVENARKLVGAIVQSRATKKFETIGQFLETIKTCIPKHNENKYLSKVFQALRIEVNSELDALKEMLQSSAKAIKKGGRLVVITYHSQEDRLVKNFIKNGKFEGEADKDIYGKTNVPFEPVNKKVIVPMDVEVEKNNRARSAKLRIAEKK
ncbi:MAG: 16S rRNA (cytosine(1402)-N(4))-methyltransferase RsmH [Bacteroidia bacterium]|nr:16S rRNA (cytosine(1402)-N(4))-methyltransferase RsmH [Bacteroidia bacterium]